MMNLQSLSPSSWYIRGCQEGMPQLPHTPTGAAQPTATIAYNNLVYMYLLVFFIMLKFLSDMLVEFLIITVLFCNML